MDYPCPRLCPMRLVADGGGLVAVCGRDFDRCADEKIVADDAFQIEVDAGTVTSVLQRMLRLPAVPPGHERAAIELGTRRVGRHAVRLVLVPRPQLITDWIERTVREDPARVLVLITFIAAQVPRNTARLIEGTRVEWVSLDEALHGEQGYLDLSDVWLRLASAAVVAAELWPRFAFVVDEARQFWAYAGVRLPLDRHPLETKLLQVLLQDAGRPVLRKDLMVALWPEAFGGKRAPNLDSLDDRLRQVKKGLSDMFKALKLPEGAPSDPIDAVRTRTDADGGYRVAVEPERVFVVD